MKKTYETPSMEVVKFQYRDQVVAASGEKCNNKWTNDGEHACVDGTPEFVRNFLD